MKAAVITSIGHVSIETVEDPTPKSREVVVRVAACGICGTDLHILHGEMSGKFPITPGHEFAGEVVALGTDYTSLKVGDRVAVDPSLYCFDCYYCKIGRNNLCERWGAIGVTNPGGVAEYVAVPGANCVVLPDFVRIEDAALIEPLSCAVRGFDILQERLASSVLIYGAGTMGLMMLELAKSAGSSTVDVVDPNADRLETAKILGLSSSARSADELEMPRGWDIVIDASGNESAIRDGLDRVGPGGTFLQFGVADSHTRVEIDPFRIYNKEITITGSMAVLHSFGRAAELFAKGVIDPDIFISDRMSLDEFPRALEEFEAGKGRKYQITP